MPLVSHDFGKQHILEGLIMAIRRSAGALTVACATAGLIAFSAVASAQSSRVRPFPVTGGSGKPVNISVSYQFFLEGETREMSDQAGLADQGRRHLYKLLAKECEVLLQTIASTCYMNRANVSTQLRNQSPRTQRGIRVSGSATYRVELKPNKPNDE